MVKTTVLLMLLSGSVATSVSAQQVVPPLKKEFLDSSFVVLPSAVGARYRRETEYVDSVGGEMRDYYLSGQLQSRATYDHFRKNIISGMFESWYANGQQQWHSAYGHGKREGERLFYYPSGQLKRRETYVAGQRTTGECYRADGTPVLFFEYEIMPVYPEGDGGARTIVTAVARNVEYPADALRAGITGKALVKFVVTDKGEVADIEVVKSVSPSIDQAAVQAVRKLKRFTPGQQDGKQVRVAYTVPSRSLLRIAHVRYSVSVLLTSCLRRRNKIQLTD